MPDHFAQTHTTAEDARPTRELHPTEASNEAFDADTEGTVYRRVTFESMHSNQLFMNYLTIADSAMGGVEEISALTDMFADEAQAEAYVRAETAGIRLALAVRVRRLTEPNQRRLARHNKRKARVQGQLDHLPGGKANPTTFDAQLLRNARLKKQAYRTCPGCQNRINVNQIQSLDCPVCQHPDFIVTKGQQARRQKLIERHKRLNAQLAEVNDKIATVHDINDMDPKGWYWYVGTWCPDDHQPAKGRHAQTREPHHE